MGNIRSMAGQANASTQRCRASDLPHSPGLVNLFCMSDVQALPALPANALEWRAIRSPGPGGQNVNKVATAIQLRVHLSKIDLPAPVRARLLRLAGRRVSGDGILLIEANRFRSQERNRADALERFEQLLGKALIKPKRRIPTRVSRGQKQQRMDDKRKRGQVKRLRGRGGAED